MQLVYFLVQRNTDALRRLEPAGATCSIAGAADTDVVLAGTRDAGTVVVEVGEGTRWEGITGG